jgi:hypothetical protein
MKTNLLKIATLLFMLSAGNTSFAGTSENGQSYTELTWIRNFTKIEVHGNVQLHLLSGDKCRVEMNSTYFDHNALVQVENGVLRITCYRAERLNVWVTADDLRSLSAYDNVLVQTEGKFSALEFDVELYNKAKADLNLDCFAANVKLNDRSMADITGTAIESDLTSNYAATLNAAEFTADDLSRERVNPIWETRVEFLGNRNYDPFTSLADEDSGSLPGRNELRFSSAASKPVEFKIPANVDRISVTTSVIN